MSAKRSTPETYAGVSCSQINTDSSSTGREKHDERRFPAIFCTILWLKPVNCGLALKPSNRSIDALAFQLTEMKVVLDNANRIEQVSNEWVIRQQTLLQHPLTSMMSSIILNWLKSKMRCPSAFNLGRSLSSRTNFPDAFTRRSTVLVSGCWSLTSASTPLRRNGWLQHLRSCIARFYNSMNGYSWDIVTSIKWSLYWLTHIDAWSVKGLFLVAMKKL